MSNENSHKMVFVITKTTIIVGVVLFSLGYFVGNTLPVTNVDTQLQSKDKATIQQTDSSEQKLAGSVNFDIPPFAKFRGSDSAKINLVEFGDYQCPFCKRFFDQTEPALTSEYVDTGKTKFYFLDVSIVGADSLTLAQASWCADEQGKYYEYHDYIYSHQGQENSGWGTPDKVKNLAKGISGLDIEKFSECLDSKKYESRSQQLTKFASQIGLTGTPTMFVGNPEMGYTKITGAQPYSSFKQVTDTYLQ